MESQRSYFGKALVELGRRDPRVVVVGADTTESIKTIDFGKAFPDRFVQLGIAEPNMVSVAAGLAAAGKIAFASTYSVFGSAHTYNIVRQNVAYTNLNVKIFASHAGLTVGPDGATHQVNEDIGLMRGLPRMTVLVPADGPQTAKCVDAAAELEGPVYCRFSRTNVPTITSTDDDFQVGRAYVLRDGADVTLVGVGLMVARCLQAADALDREGVDARVVNLPTVKPLDEPALMKAAHETGAIVTAEEHTVVHGVGAAVASVVVRDRPVPMAFVGMKDVFGESGEADELLRKYGLTAEAIAESARDVMKRRGRPAGGSRGKRIEGTAK
jgi:transketolase